MASRIAARYVSRRLLSSGGKVLGEEEKAAENIYIKKMEQEKLDKLARKGAGQPAEQPPTTPGATAADVKPGASTTGVSTDKYRNYAVVAGTATLICGLGWYFMTKPKKTGEISD